MTFPRNPARKTSQIILRRIKAKKVYQSKQSTKVNYILKDKLHGNTINIIIMLSKTPYNSTCCLSLCFVFYYDYPMTLYLTVSS